MDASTYNRWAALPRTEAQRAALLHWCATRELTAALLPEDRAWIGHGVEPVATEPLALRLTRPETLLDRLRHTLAVCDDQSADEIALLATSNVVGDGVVTGLTWGDLRRLDVGIRRLIAQGRVDQGLFE